MPLKSLGVPTSDFDNLFARTGTDAAGAAPPGFSATGGTKKGNTIVLQGDHIKKVKIVLGDLGFPMEVV